MIGGICLARSTDPLRGWKPLRSRGHIPWGVPGPIAKDSKSARNSIGRAAPLNGGWITRIAVAESRMHSGVNLLGNGEQVRGSTASGRTPGIRWAGGEPSLPRGRG